MLTSGQPSRLSREDAMALLAEAHRAQPELERLTTGRRRLVDGAG
jgi:hypothetical protein